MNIVAIGGGEKTPAIKRAIELTAVDKPSVLLLPSACSTERSFASKVPVLTTYFEELGIDAKTLHEFNEIPSYTKLEHEIGAASLLYTIGGNSPHMLRTMRLHGSDEIVKQAILDGKVHAGTSAGALLPFELAHSNVAKKPAEEQWDYDYLDMLGILPGVATVHADQHDPTPYGTRANSRLDSLIETFPANMTRGYAIDNGAAMIFGSQPTIIRSHSGAEAHVIERQDARTVTIRGATDEDLRLP